MHRFFAFALLFLSLKKTVFGQSVRHTPSRDAHFLSELKKGENLDLPFQIYQFTHSHFGFSNGIAKDPEAFCGSVGG